MRISRLVLALGCVAFVTACSDHATTDQVAGPQFKQINPSPGCPSPQQVEDWIVALFPKDNQSAVLSRFAQITTKDDPHVQAVRFVDYVIKKYFAGQLSGGTSNATRLQTISLLNAALCAAGLPQVFGPTSLVDDGAVAFIYPTTPDTTVVTGTLWAGVEVPAASVTEPTVVTISRLPDTPGPLLTEFDQYPLFYEFHSTGTTNFLNYLTIGVCTATSVLPPDPSRLRLAHNVAPYTPGSIEVLPLAPAPFLDCTDADVAAAPSSRWMQFAGFNIFRRAADVILPRPLYAMKKFGSGLGGTVRSFSPFGAVDTLAVLTPVGGLTKYDNTGRLVDVPPTVRLSTPTGHLMYGVGVDFAQTQGDAVLTGGGLVLTDVNGVAATTSWEVGTVTSKVTATALSPAGTGFVGNPATFTANVVP